MTNSWKYDRAKDAIDKRIDEVETVEIFDYKRDMSLESIPTNRAYRVDGVHMYADIQNLEGILATTESEGERCHKRALRFLNLHQRAVHRLLDRCRDVVADQTISIVEKRAILASWASDAAAVASNPALRELPGSRRLVTIDEVLEALAALDHHPKGPPGGKPARMKSAARVGVAA